MFVHLSRISTMKLKACKKMKQRLVQWEEAGRSTAQRTAGKEKGKIDDGKQRQDMRGAIQTQTRREYAR